LIATIKESNKMVKTIMVLGALNAKLRANGTVKTSLTVRELSGKRVVLRPLLAKNLATAEQGFITTYGLTPAQAAAFRARIERDGCASVHAAI
jgi:hypothetical protein